MRVPTRKPTTRREPTRVLITLARGAHRRTTLVLVGRETAFDASEEWTAT